MTAQDLGGGGLCEGGVGGVGGVGIGDGVGAEGIGGGGGMVGAGDRYMHAGGGGAGGEGRGSGGIGGGGDRIHKYSDGDGDHFSRPPGVARRVDFGAWENLPLDKVRFFSSFPGGKSRGEKCRKHQYYRFQLKY